MRIYEPDASAKLSAHAGEIDMHLHRLAEWADTAQGQPVTQN